MFSKNRAEELGDAEILYAGSTPGTASLSGLVAHFHWFAYWRITGAPHAGESMDDLYDKIKEDVKFRREQAESCGVGFELPLIVPNVPKKAPKTKAAKAAN